MKAALVASFVILFAGSAFCASPPAITWSSPYAGLGFADPQGNIYQVGISAVSAGISYLSKVSSQGQLLLLISLPGTAFGVSADRAGNVFVTGLTYPSSRSKIFVAEFDPGLTRQVFYMEFGGKAEAGWDSPQGIAVDGDGFVYVAGSTVSFDFPVTSGAFQTNFGQTGCQQLVTCSDDLFVVKIDLRTAKFVYATYLGGNSGDYFTGLAVDGIGNAYIIGNTDSTDFPATEGAFQTKPVLDHTIPGFVVKLNPAGSALVYSTFFSAFPNAFALDADGSVYLSGVAYPGSLPATPGAYQTNAVSQSAYVAKLSPDGRSLVFATYFGPLSFEGDARTIANGMAIDPDGNIVITGDTLAKTLPLMDPIWPGPTATTATGCMGFTIENRPFNYNCHDGFIAKFAPDGGRLLLASYLGAARDSTVRGVAADSSGNLYVTGFGLPNFKAGETPNMSAGTSYLIKIEPAPPRPLALPAGVLSSADFTSPIAAGGMGTIFGVGLTGVDGVATATFPLPTELAGTSVSVNGIAAPILAVANVNGHQQINFQVPNGIAGLVTLSIRSHVGATFSLPVQMTSTGMAPSIFGAGTTSKPAWFTRITVW